MKEHFFFSFQPDIEALLSLTPEEYSNSLNEDEVSEPVIKQEETSQEEEEPMKRHQMRRWTGEQMSALIDTWEKFYKDLLKAEDKSPIFREIAENLQARIQREDPYTEADIQHKIGVLRRKYK